MNIYHCTFAPNSDPDNIQREDLMAESPEQVRRIYQAVYCMVLDIEEAPEVAPWDEDLGARFIVSGGEVLELDSHLESAYDERNGDIETDMIF